MDCERILLVSHIYFFFLVKICKSTLLSNFIMLTTYQAFDKLSLMEWMANSLMSPHKGKMSIVAI